MWCSLSLFSKLARPSRRRGTAKRSGYNGEPPIWLWVLATTFALSWLNLPHHQMAGVFWAMPLRFAILAPPPPPQAQRLQRRSFVSAALHSSSAPRPTTEFPRATDTQRPMGLPSLIVREWVLAIALVAVCHPFVIPLLVVRNVFINVLIAALAHLSPDHCP